MKKKLVKREDGYYWVVDKSNKLIIAEWQNDVWYLLGCAMMYYDNDFIQIKEQIKYEL